MTSPPSRFWLRRHEAGERACLAESETSPVPCGWQLGGFANARRAYEGSVSKLTQAAGQLFRATVIN